MIMFKILQSIIFCYRIVKDEFCEQNKFRLNGFTIKSQLLREQKGLCINMKDKKLTTM